MIEMPTYRIERCATSTDWEFYGIAAPAPEWRDVAKTLREGSAYSGRSLYMYRTLNGALWMFGRCHEPPYAQIEYKHASAFAAEIDRALDAEDDAFEYRRVEGLRQTREFGGAIIGRVLTKYEADVSQHKAAVAAARKERMVQPGHEEYTPSSRVQCACSTVGADRCPTCRPACECIKGMQPGDTFETDGDHRLHNATCPKAVIAAPPTDEEIVAAMEERIRANGTDEEYANVWKLGGVYVAGRRVPMEEAERAWSRVLAARVAASAAQRAEAERWSNAVQIDDGDDVGAKDA